jgi:hypothetical protein
MKETVECTVYSYFDLRYGIKLRHKKMPIVLTKFGWYPVELLFQSFTLVRGANGENQKKAVLTYHDRYSGRGKIEKLGKDNDAFRRRFPHGQLLEREFGFRFTSEPLTQKAKLLAEPSLAFGGNQPAQVKNGSWNFRDGQLYRPANLPSFAVVDFSDKSDNGGRNLINGVLKRAKEHGLRIPQFEMEHALLVDELTVSAPGLHQGGNTRMVEQVRTAVT